MFSVIKEDAVCFGKSTDGVDNTEKEVSNAHQEKETFYMEIPRFIYITSMTKVGTSLTAVTEIDQTTLQNPKLKPSHEAILWQYVGHFLCDFIVT